MSQTTINIDEQIKARNKILENLAYLNKESFAKKKDYIIQLKDVERPLVLSGYYPDVSLSDLCSHIGKTLTERNIEYSSGHLAELFDDDEKRTQHRSNNSPDGGVSNSPPLEPTEDSIIGQLDFLEKQIGKSYDTMVDYAPADKLNTLEIISAKHTAHLKSFIKKLYTAHHFVDSFERTFGDADAAEITLKGLPKKQRERLDALYNIYNASNLLIAEMESSLVDITTNTIKEIQADQLITSREIDERNKLSTWEKLTITLARLNGKISKNFTARLHGVDKKHLSNNIEPVINPLTGKKNKHHDIFEMPWFKTMRVVCTCGKENIFDATQKIEEDLIRNSLDLQSKPTVLVNVKVK